jgi:ribosomal protein S18 acetylase RimI-like enzyme
MTYQAELRLPTTDEYLTLRKSVGWPLFSREVVTRALSNSLFGVCVRHADRVIGMGRVIGDGSIYFHIQDVVVDVDHQRSGVGKILMEELMKYINQNAGSHANVGLMCSKGRERFYEEFGFTIRPGEKFGAGMIKIME